MNHNTSNNQDREFGEKLARVLSNAEWVLDWIESTFDVNEVFGDDEIKKYVNNTMSPEDVFDSNELSQWAEENGYIEKN